MTLQYALPTRPHCQMRHIHHRKPAIPLNAKAAGRLIAAARHAFRCRA
jgi:hypothetical protein